MLFAAGAGAGIIVVVAVVLLLVQLFASDKIALATQGVKEVSPAEEPELHGIIDGSACRPTCRSRACA